MSTTDLGKKISDNGFYIPRNARTQEMLLLGMGDANTEHLIRQHDILLDHHSTMYVLNSKVLSDYAIIELRPIQEGDRVTIWEVRDTVFGVCCVKCLAVGPEQCIAFYRDRFNKCN